uniref:Ubiquitin carboxyl-terminal hydrolase n=2 Tax=Panagrolaimus sp. JU765 TaxID=591449 RepID=A0AC34RAQ9_9BILA
MSDQKTYWPPLESNPETMEKFIKDIGVHGIRCEDVFGFDEECLGFIPKPHYAMILCFPEYKNAYKIVEPHYDELKNKGFEHPENIFFMKQKIGNACGTFALLHSLSNLKDKIDIGTGSFAKWLEKAAPLSIEDRSDSLLHDSEMSQAHESCARSGETELGDDDVEHHFITFLNIDGTLYELDSQMDFARPIGPTTDETLFKDDLETVHSVLLHLLVMIKYFDLTFYQSSGSRRSLAVYFDASFFMNALSSAFFKLLATKNSLAG